MRTSALPVCLARWRVKRVYRVCVVACQPCAGERRPASAIAMSGSSRGTTKNCCRAPTCHTNDACGRPEQAPQQTGGRSSSSAARSAARRSSAAQQCSSMQALARRPHAMVACCLCHEACCLCHEGQIRIRIRCRVQLQLYRLFILFSASGFDPRKACEALAPHECICTTCPPHRDNVD